MAAKKQHVRTYAGDGTIFQHRKDGTILVQLEDGQLKTFDPSAVQHICSRCRELVAWCHCEGRMWGLLRKPAPEIQICESDALAIYRGGKEEVIRTQQERPELQGHSPAAVYEAALFWLAWAESRAQNVMAIKFDAPHTGVM